MKRKNILKNVAILGGGTGVSQGLILVASPLLTRIYTPEDFGVLAVFGSIIGLIGGLSCLRYEHALPLVKDDAEAANLVALCGGILSAILFVFCAVLLAFGDEIPGWLNNPALQPYIWLLPVGVLAIAFAQMGRLWALRVKEFKRVAGAGVASSVVTLLFQFGLGALQFGPAGLISGRVGGTICSGIILLYLPLRNARSLVRNVKLQDVKEVAKRYRQFPLFFALSSGINSFGREMPIIFLSLFFGPAVTGLYAMTRRVLNLPMLLIGGHVRKVYYSYAADEKRDGDLQQLTRTIFVGLVQVALPGMIIIGIVAPELFALVFGAPWKEAGVFAQWLCPWLFMVFVCSPLTRLPLILERQGSELIFQVIILIMRALALAIGGVAQNVMVAFGLFGAVSVLCWIGFLFWSMRLVEIKPAEIVGILVRELLIAAPIVAPAILAKFVLLAPDQDLWLVAVSVGCALVAMCILIFRTRHFIFPIRASR